MANPLAKRDFFERGDFKWIFAKMRDEPRKADLKIPKNLMREMQIKS